MRSIALASPTTSPQLNDIVGGRCRIRSTSPLQSLSRECGKIWPFENKRVYCRAPAPIPVQLWPQIRRRKRVIRIYRNDEAALRLIGVLLAERNEAGQVRLYLDMDEFMEWPAARQMQNDIANNVVEEAARSPGATIGERQHCATSIRPARKPRRWSRPSRDCQNLSNENPMQV